MIIRCIISILLILTIGYPIKSQEISKSDLDVIRYYLQLEPDFTMQHIRGTVSIEFKTNDDEVSFDCGSLVVENISGSGFRSFSQKGDKLIIILNGKKSARYNLQLFYHGSPKRGAVFTESNQLYSVFSTSEWMICNMAPDDRASMEVDLKIPSDLKCVANGTFVKQTKEDNKMVYSWKQTIPSPAYTYGFAIGSFNESDKIHHDVTLKYYAVGYDSQKLDIIFKHAGDMITYFEERSGIPYFQRTYSQVLIGNSLSGNDRPIRL